MVLAAGAGQRFAASGAGEHKLVTSVRGEALVNHAVRAATAAAVGEVVVVQGAVDLTEHVPAGTTLVDNPRWPEGISTSLQAALDHARARRCSAVVVGLADQPGVGPAAWRAVAASPSLPPIAVATYDGRRANPVRLAEAVWDLLPETGDEGARAVMRDRPELVREIPCSGEPWDVDTVEDLERWS
ncbi:MAG: NTP transferase domain-containing protein [Acidimicrobiales bacterium]|nr:NTP transferase domain-containing protein [Acidimicrobiales bacterium]